MAIRRSSSQIRSFNLHSLLKTPTITSKEAGFAVKCNLFSMQKAPTRHWHPVAMIERSAMPTLSRHLIPVSLISLALLTGCPPDNTPLIEENERLKEQLVKHESLMTTLQEGNRVLQEQVDRLSQELRENETEFAKRLEVAQRTGQGLSTEKQNLLQQVAALTNKNRKLKLDAQKLRKRLELVQQTGQGLSAEKQNLLQQIEALMQENRKLQADGQKFKKDAQWLRKQRELVRQALQASNTAVQAETLPYKLPDATKAALQALANNGYTLMAKMETDQKSVFITERKASPSASLEVPGYRNQYLVELETQPDNQTALKVRADYEEMTSGGTIVEVGEEERSEIEARLIQVIQQILGQPEETPEPQDLAPQPEDSEEPDDA